MGICAGHACQADARFPGIWKWNAVSLEEGSQITGEDSPVSGRPHSVALNFALFKPSFHGLSGVMTDSGDIGGRKSLFMHGLCDLCDLCVLCEMYFLVRGLSIISFEVPCSELQGISQM